MKLIVSGEWIGQKGFYEAHIENVKFYSSLSETKKINSLSFVVFSYDLSQETLNLNLKKTYLPSIIVVQIKDFRKIKAYSNPSQIFLKNKALNDNEFKSRVLKIKDLIRDGTVYQINLTNRFDFELCGEPLTLFFNFYKNQPVPYAFFLDLNYFFIISGSMELFLGKINNTIISKPIKGTSTSFQFLEKSEKDKAENLMITDMMRNDIGRVAKIGTVKVTELFKITKYKTLYQMHSTVEGKTDKSLIDIIKATFPPASVTGAPKRKAVQMIDILEPHARGYYCGCAGLIKNNNDFILSVLIRTVIGQRNNISYYAGCGIVLDSDPQKELEELYLKIKAFNTIYKQI